MLASRLADMSAAVALRKESVDRNNICTNNHVRVRKSLSARRAWIEMVELTTLVNKLLSLSARRAWIEIGSAWVQEFPEL